MGKKSAPPPAPDYKALAEQTNASNKAAVQEQTTANRPNQTDVYGNTSRWTQGPNGEWTQTQKLSDQSQRIMDQQSNLQERLTGQVADAMKDPLTAEGLPTADLEKVRSKAGMFNMDPTGNSQAIQDATYKLLQPARQQERASEIQRLKNQGLTEDSPAFQRAVQRLDSGDTDAGLKALLAGQQEYGNAFQRGLSASDQNYSQTMDSETFANALRTGGLAERSVLRDQSADDLGKLMELRNASSPQFGQFMAANTAGGVNYSGAGQQQYQAEVGNTNAANAGKAGTTSGLISLAGTAAAFF